MFHINHVLVPPAIHAVMADGVAKVNAFIGPSHVSVITGADIYLPIVDRYQVPVVVSGFEPVDVMEALLMMVRQKVEVATRWRCNTAGRSPPAATGPPSGWSSAFRDPRALSLAWPWGYQRLRPAPAGCLCQARCRAPLSTQ